MSRRLDTSSTTHMAQILVQYGRSSCSCEKPIVKLTCLTTVKVWWRLFCKTQPWANVNTLVSLWQVLMCAMTGSIRQGCYCVEMPTPPLRLRSLLQNTTLGPLCLNGDGHVLLCHCRHPNLLAVNRHVFVSRDTSLSAFDAAFRTKEASRGDGTHLRHRRSPSRTVPNGSRHFHRLRRSRKNRPRSPVALTLHEVLHRLRDDPLATRSHVAVTPLVITPVSNCDERCGVAVTGLRTRGVLFSRKRRRCPWVVSVHELLKSAPGMTLWRNFFPEPVLPKASSQELPLGYAREWYSKDSRSMTLLPISSSFTQKKLASSGVLKEHVSSDMLRHEGPESWSSMEDPVVPLERNLFGHPLAGLLWERAILESSFLKYSCEKFQIETLVR